MSSQCLFLLLFSFFLTHTSIYNSFVILFVKRFSISTPLPPSKSITYAPKRLQKILHGRRMKYHLIAITTSPDFISYSNTSCKLLKKKKTKIVLRLSRTEIVELYYISNSADTLAYSGICCGVYTVLTKIIFDLYFNNYYLFS